MSRCYGAPRVHAALRRAGRVVNAKKVERLMRKHRIVGITRRLRRGLPRQAKRAVFALDLIGRDFTAPRPGMRLVGDMTELVTLERKLYLATCIDLATREVVGWAMADHHRAELPVAASRMAAGRGGLELGCVKHTDRGSEYTSDEFRTEMRKLRMRQSMGRVGSCYDNAAAESWFVILKAGDRDDHVGDPRSRPGRRFPLRSGRVQPQPAPSAPRLRVRHPARNEIPAQAEPRPGSVNTRCPVRGGNFIHPAKVGPSSGAPTFLCVLRFASSRRSPRGQPTVP
ncbi:IS3 family transposase [Streptomyces finlayi]|uniref:IS3 family transposase n=1 Tax=Streptomyces finlayi TaxID=67296 RepID=A0A7G7BF38_9ACTN|nr:IS3 family transposase [Streptomyces finlayi]QNE73953.1 IS3 family transposase [Streptomyces finlayi]